MPHVVDLTQHLSDLRKAHRAVAVTMNEDPASWGYAMDEMTNDQNEAFVALLRAVQQIIDASAA